MFGKKSARLKPILIALSPVVCFLFSMSIGHYEISAYEVLDMLFSKLTASEMRYGDMMQTVVFEVRLPRVILAMMVGCSLSVSGAVYQCVFKNPMASPNILGTSSGAGLGTALAIIFSFGAVYTQMISFAFGLLAVAITYAISAKIGRRGNFDPRFCSDGHLGLYRFSSFNIAGKIHRRSLRKAARHNLLADGEPIYRRQKRHFDYSHSIFTRHRAAVFDEMAA